MHQALQIDELVRHICAQACNEAADLVKLALLEKGFSRMALDVLWEDVPLKALLYLFPPSAVFSEDEQGVKLGFRRPLSTTDWTQFDLYAPRIRTIRRSRVLSDVTAFRFDNVLHFLTSCRPKAVLFPNLLCLEWNNAPLHEMTSLSIFTISSLNSFSASVRPTCGIPRSNILGISDSFEVPLWSLRDSAHSLRKLRVPIPMFPLPKRYQVPWMSLLNHSLGLVEVTSVPSPLLSYMLGALPKLRSLTFLVKHWEEPKEMEGPKAEILNPAMSKAPFPALETLVLKDSVSLSEATEVLTGANCFARRSITIYCVDRPTPEDISSFLKVGLHPTISSDLREFNFYVQPEVAAEDDSESDEDDEDDEGSGFLTFNILNPLLHCHKMEQFVLDNMIPLLLNDEDLHRISLAWPNITTLLLGKVPVRSGLTRAINPCVSLRGLDYLSACTRLSSLELIINVTEDDLETSYLSAKISNCPLRTLNVCTSYIHVGCSVTAIACFLLQRFPGLKSIFSGNGLIKDGVTWCEVLDAMAIIRRVLKNHALEIPRLVGTSSLLDS